MLTVFRSCPKKFEWEFITNLAPSAISEHLHAGGCFASALENVYERVFKHGETLDAALAYAEAAFAVQWGDYTPPEKSAKTADRIFLAVLDYFREYPPHSDPIQPFRIEDRPTYEFTFAVPLDRETTGLDFPLHPSGSPFLFAGRYDTLGHMGNKLVIRDEKTMSTVRQNWSETFDMRSQFLGYCWASQILGIAVDTVVIRGIVILKTKFHQLQTIKLYPKERIARWLEQTRRDLTRMVAAHDSGYFDYDFGDSCTSYGTCAYMPLCTSVDPSRWYSSYRKRSWNPIKADPEAIEATP